MFGKNIDKATASSHVSIDEEFSDNDNTTDVTQPQDVQVPNSKKRKKPDSNNNKKLLQDDIELQGGGRWMCKHCKNSFSGSYTRVHYHFFGSTPGVRAGIRRCQTLLVDHAKLATLRTAVKKAEESGLVSPQIKNSLISKTEKSGGLEQMKAQFGIMERVAVDESIMRFLAANGIAFNVLRSPQFKEMVSSILRAPKGYTGPSYEKARTTLLDECKRNVEKQLTPIKDTWHTQGVSIVSDGWTNVKNEPLINVIAENSRGATFLYGSNFSGVEKTGVEIADYLLKSIDEVGPSNVVQVITDNASNCKAAGTEIQKVHRHIFWSPCVVHTLNLVFKEFGDSFEWLQNTYNKGKTIMKFIVDHQHSLALFRSNSKLELLKVAKTRFATHYILLKRLMDCRESLVTVTCLNKWRDWIKRLDEKTRKIADEVTECIKSDSFWDEVEHCLLVLAPMYNVLRFADGEGILMGEIYEKMDNMLGELKDIMQHHRYSADFGAMERSL